MPIIPANFLVLQISKKLENRFKKSDGPSGTNPARASASIGVPAKHIFHGKSLGKKADKMPYEVCESKPAMASAFIGVAYWWTLMPLRALRYPQGHRHSIV